MKAIRIHEIGGPEALIYEDCPSPTPGPGQVLIEQVHGLLAVPGQSRCLSMPA